MQPSAAERIAAATPSARNRVVDLVRVAALSVVVLGHWLLAAVWLDDGELRTGAVLELAPWTHPLTWVFQVMPLFFIVGGYANTRSWRTARRHGDAWLQWLRTRLRRAPARRAPAGARAGLQRLMALPRPRARTVMLGSRIMSVHLWHLT